MPPLISNPAPKILNILNGDCALTPFENAALPGETLVWREVYTEGPLDSPDDLSRFRAGRAEFLASVTNYSLEKMRNWTEKLDRSILELRREDVLRLWFDACMFDQSILARILSLVNRIPEERRPRVELACENVIFSDAKIFSDLNVKRKVLQRNDIRNGALCWKSFVNYDVPEKVSPFFRFMRAALERRRREKPDRNGLGETQRRILELVNVSSAHGIALPELFQRLSAQEQYPWFGMETVQRFAAALAGKNCLRIENGRYFARQPAIPRPKLWETSPDPLWNDEHISKGMLTAHLNSDTDAASRKSEFIDRSVRWIAELCAPASGKKLLDLGCGPGLYTERFHKAGFTVSGIDCSSRSIAYAKGHSDAGIFYQCADYLEAEFPLNLDIVTMIYCDFGVLPPEARCKLLSKVFHALSPGGCFVFDVFTPRQYDGFRETSRTAESPSGGFWSPAPHMVTEHYFSYPDDHTFLHRVEVADPAALKVYHIWEHVFLRRELRSMLLHAGFSSVQFFGDIGGKKLSSRNKTLCVVARK